MSQVKKVVVAILISMSFFMSDVVFASQPENGKGEKIVKPASSRIIEMVAEKYSRVIQLYEGVLVIQIEQKAIFLSSTKDAKSIAQEGPERKPGHTHEETRHELEKIGPEEES